MARNAVGLAPADCIRTLRFTPRQDRLFARLQALHGGLSVGSLVKRWMLCDAQSQIPTSPELAAVQEEMKERQLGLFTEQPSLPCLGGCGKPGPFPCSKCGGPLCGLLECTAKHEEDRTRHPVADLDFAAADEERRQPAAEGQQRAAPSAESYEGGAGAVNEDKPGEVRNRPTVGAGRLPDLREPPSLLAAGEGRKVTSLLAAALEEHLPPGVLAGARASVGVEALADVATELAPNKRQDEAAVCNGSDKAGVPAAGKVKCFTCKRVFKGRVGKGMSCIVRPHTTDGALLPHDDADEAMCTGSYVPGCEPAEGVAGPVVTCLVCLKRVPQGKSPLFPAWHTEQGLVVGPMKTPPASSSTRTSTDTRKAPPAAARKAPATSSASSSTRTSTGTRKAPPAAARKAPATSPASSSTRTSTGTRKAPPAASTRTSTGTRKAPPAAARKATPTRKRGAR